MRPCDGNGKQYKCLNCTKCRRRDGVGPPRSDAAGAAVLNGRNLQFRLCTEARSQRQIRIPISEHSAKANLAMTSDCNLGLGTVGPQRRGTQSPEEKGRGIFSDSSCNGVRLRIQHTLNLSHPASARQGVGNGLRESVLKPR